MNWWDKRNTGPPRPVEGGIKTRKSRGEIGSTWWSQRFVRALEQIAEPARLARGRSYARAGQVVALEVAPGRVSARVQGSQVEPYEVTIDLPPVSAAAWNTIEEHLADHAGYAAALLAGEIPHDITQVFKDAGHPLFPTRKSQLVSDCTCSDFQVPCKHVAAAYYILAEQFDEDPFLLLRWRGRAREPLLDRLATLRQAGADETPAPPREPALRDTLDTFWQGADVPVAATQAPPWFLSAGPMIIDGVDRRVVFVGLIEEVTRA